MRALSVLLACCLACGDDDLPAADGGADVSTPDAEVDASVDSNTSDVADAPPDAFASCTEDIDCDDGVECTQDFCRAVEGSCTDPTDRSTCAQECAAWVDSDACGMGQVCTPAGCTSPTACEESSDCDDSDPCIARATCNVVSRTCQLRLLDGDGDGDPPLICGGSDCNDAEFFISRFSDERCDGIDSDCDGVIDEDDMCVGEGTCVDGECSCDGGRDYCFDAGCRDVSTDSEHCGSCFHECADGIECVEAACDCPDGLTDCSGECVDTDTYPLDCGACGDFCRGECLGGVCDESCGDNGERCCAWPGYPRLCFDGGCNASDMCQAACGGPGEPCCEILETCDAGTCTDGLCP